jgi:hypothetical protein
VLLSYIADQLTDMLVMPGKRAKILSAPDIGDLLLFASCTRHPLRNTVMVLLSAKAGLRAGEIANLSRGQEMQRQINTGSPGPRCCFGRLAEDRSAVRPCHCV